MYQVDGKDEVIELDDVPQSSVGAPLPIVLSDEQKVLLAYLLQEDLGDWDGTTVRIASASVAHEPIAVVQFNSVESFMFGAPNDEAFHGHPLYGRGLHPYGAFEVKNSSWIRRLERMNSVHHCHSPDAFWALKHFVFAFHDTTFECVAKDFEIAVYENKSMMEILPIMQSRLFS